MSEMTMDIKSLGKLLKERRNERNLSLKEVENGTSIRIGYLQAIEEGDFKKMISPVYAQGFVKQYANFLGVEVEEILRENPEIFKPQKNFQEFTYGIGTLEMRNHPSSSVKWVPNALWVGLFTLLLILAWYLARYLELL